MCTSDTGICTVESLVARDRGRLRELVFFEKNQESILELN